MTVIELRPDSTRAQARHAHEILGETDPRSTVTLRLAADLRPTTPGQSSAWLQLVLTWGQNFDERILELPEQTSRDLTAGEDLSDLLILAVFLASSVRCDGRDITDEVAPIAREALEARNRLTVHHGDGEVPTSSILLAEHTFTNNTSPELHERWEGNLAIEESARTLYHDVWPTAGTSEPLRKPFSEFGEHEAPPEAPTHITRASLDTGGDFVPLSTRAPRPRGLAYELATAVRQQPKPLQEEIGEILFELAQNTEWHALEQAGGRTGANCRAVTFREYRYGREELAAAMTFDPQFVRYVVAVANHTQSLTGRRVDSLSIGTITVVDSGIGLARSAAMSIGEGHLYAPETEVGYLTKALAKSLRSRRRMLGNIGLARVQQSLANLRGYMSIRTGTVEVLRDFVTTEFEPLGEIARPAPPSVLVDWIPPSEADFVVGPRVGTAVTIAYPVDIGVGD